MPAFFDDLKFDSVAVALYGQRFSEPFPKQNRLTIMLLTSNEVTFDFQTLELMANNYKQV
jgi:hypothetical protein